MMYTMHVQLSRVILQPQLTTYWLIILLLLGEVVGEYDVKNDTSVTVGLFCFNEGGEPHQATNC